MNKYKMLFILLLVLVLTRVVVLLFFTDKFFMFEELHHGMIAKEIMEGPDLPIFDYPLTNYGHGGLWSGVMTIPFFAIFGKNLFALLLTPVLFSVLILTILFLFADKFFNRRVAIITGLLYIFSSRIWFTFNLHNGGLHFENLIFTVSAMYLFYEIIFNGKTKHVNYFALGLISGLGTYWVYTYLVTLAAIMLLWFLRDKKLFLKGTFYIFLTGFLVGMLPWFYYNSGTHFESVRGVFLDGFFADKDYLSLNTWIRVIWRFLNNMYFPDMLGITKQKDWFGKLYFLFYGLSFLYILRFYKFSFKKIIFSRDSFVLLFPVILLVIVPFYGDQVHATGHDTVPNSSYMEWRYIVGLFPFVFLTVAIVLDKLLQRSKVFKIISLGLLSIPVVGGVMICARSVQLKDFGSGFKQPGYSYMFLVDGLRSKYAGNLYKILDDITKLSAPEKYEVISQVFAIDPEGEVKPVDFKEYLKLSLRLDEEHKPIFYKVLIKGLFSGLSLPLKDVVKEVNVLAQQVDERYRPYLYEGVGALATAYDVLDTTKYKDYVILIDKEYVGYYYRGLSEPNYSEGITEHFNRIKSCMTWLDKEYQPLYLEGVGEVLSKMGVGYAVIKECCNKGDTPKFYNLFNNLDQVYKIDILKGMGKGLSYFYTVSTKKAIDEFIGNFNDNEKKIILKEMVDNLIN